MTGTCRRGVKLGELVTTHSPMIERIPQFGGPHQLDANRRKGSFLQPDFSRHARPGDAEKNADISIWMLKRPFRWGSIHIQLNSHEFALADFFF